MIASVNRNVKLYFVSNSLYYGSFDIIQAFLAVLVTQKVSGGSVEIVGYIVAYGMISRFIFEIIFGKFVKGFSWNTKKIIVTGGYLAYGVTTILMGFSTTIAQVFIFQSLISLIDALCYPLKWSIFTHIIDERNQEFEWSLEDVLSTMTSACLAALGGFLTQKYELSIVFIFFGISYFLSGVSFYFIKLRRFQHLFNK